MEKQERQPLHEEARETQIRLIEEDISDLEIESNRNKMLELCGELYSKKTVLAMTKMVEDYLTKLKASLAELKKD